MIIHLPESLEDSLRAEVSDGRFASVEDAVAEAVRRFLGDRNRGASVGGAVAGDADPLIGAMREAADELDEVVEEAMRRRRSEVWRDIPVE